MSADLISAYGFNEGAGSTAFDASGNNNNGQIQGATWTSNGRFGKALSFDGVNDLVTVADTSGLELTTGMTLEAWIYPTTTNGVRDIIIKEGSSVDIYNLYARNWRGLPEANVYVSGSNRTTEGAALAANVWTHVAGTYDGATVRFYINGVQRASTAITGSISTSTGALRIGGNSLWGEFFQGRIDEIRIYNRALSSGEIQADMNTAIPSVNGAVSLVTGGSATMSAHALGGAPVPIQVEAGEERNEGSTLSCFPRAATPGSHVSCELLAKGKMPARVDVTSSSDHVKTPAVLITRPGQGRIVFQASIEPDARQLPAVVTAALGDTVVQDTILVIPATAPTLKGPGNQVVRFGTPVTFEVVAADSTELPIVLTAENLPHGASFDENTGRFVWTPSASQQGGHHVFFTAMSSARQAARSEVVIEVGSGIPVLTPATNLACSPGSIAKVSGKWLASRDSVFSDRSGGADELGGTRVRVNGLYVPVLQTEPSQIEFLCPLLDPGTQLSIAVEAGSAASEPISATLQESSPAIFALGDSIQDQGLVSHIGTTDLVMERNFRVHAHPAQPGDEILIRATGIRSAVEGPTGGLSVKVGDAFAGIQSVEPIPGYAGAYGIRVRVPESAVFGPAVPIEVAVTTPSGKHFVSNKVTVAIERSEH